MYLGKVIGTVVSTSKVDALIGHKFLLFQPLSEKFAPVGHVEIAVDACGAGAGELVMVLKGSSARSLFDGKSSPIDAAIVGIVDQVEVTV